MSGVTTQPKLRLVGESISATTSGGNSLTQSPHASHPVLEATDPRWVLALRVNEALQGSLLNLENREKLIRLGKVLGLNAFESNLVIAIVQDQSRRGMNLQAAANTLAFVPMSRFTQSKSLLSWRVIALASVVMSVECLLIWVMF